LDNPGWVAHISHPADYDYDGLLHLPFSSFLRP
jgi:hypothetical protein